MFSACKEMLLTPTSISFCPNLAQKTSLKSTSPYVELFSLVRQWLELPGVYCSIAYDHHTKPPTISKISISSFGRYFLTSSWINYLRGVWLHLYMFELEYEESTSDVQEDVFNSSVYFPNQNQIKVKKVLNFQIT